MSDNCDVNSLLVISCIANKYCDYSERSNTYRMQLIKTLLMTLCYYIKPVSLLDLIVLFAAKLIWVKTLLRLNYKRTRGLY